METQLGGKRPKDLSKKKHESLKLRWGYKDMKVRKLKTVSSETGVPINDMLEAEIELLEKLGWSVKNTAAERKKWLRK